jgi:tripartite-type tricarboxylate transporter receptor subunit TctC
MAIRKDLGVNSIADIVEKPVVTGATGRGSYQFIVPTLLNEFMGTKFNTITTYTGTSEAMLAVERGEIGAMMTSLISIQESRADWVDGSGLAKIILQVGEDPDPALPGVPMLSSLAKDDNQAAIYRFLSISNAMARSLVLPEGVPEDRVAILRKAFDELMADPKFQADAKELNIPLVSANADKLREIIAATLATPSDIVALTTKYTTEQ